MPRSGDRVGPNLGPSEVVFSVGFFLLLPSYSSVSFSTPCFYSVGVFHVVFV